MMIKEDELRDIYVPPKEVSDTAECNFYHTMDIPGKGTLTGEWDLRGREDKYLGGVNFEGKRVLELGTASGFLCFYMEKSGAEVIAHDVRDGGEWDIVPFSQYDYRQTIEKNRVYCQELKNAFWYSHKAHNSKAKVIYSSIYDIPKEIGQVDIATFSSLLLHLRHPFLALQNTLSRVKETVIVTDLVPRHPLFNLPHTLRGRLSFFIKKVVLAKDMGQVESSVPYLEFLPNFRTQEHKDVWWYISPKTVVNFLGLLGFEQSRTTYHYQKLHGKEYPLYTVVAQRTRKIDA